MALDASPGGPNSNAYCTVSEASAVLMNRLDGQPWFDEGSDTVQPVFTLTQRREAALIWATQLLDTLVVWRGMPATTTQALWWPQSGQVDSRGRPIDPATVPDDIKEATAVYALALLRDASDGGSAASGTAAIRRKKIGGLEIEYQQQSSAAVAKPASTSLPTELRALLRPYGAYTSTLVVPLVRA